MDAVKTVSFISLIAIIGTSKDGLKLVRTDKFTDSLETIVFRRTDWNDEKYSGVHKSGTLMSL